MSERTPLYETHCAMHAKMVDFHGFLMPLHYGSQIEEHHAVRNHAGIFDVSHMGVVDVKGEQVIPFIRTVLANDIAKIKSGRALYSCLLNENGGVIDDLIAYRIHDQHVRLIINAACAEKDLAWLRQNNSHGVLIQRLTHQALLALQGKVIANLIPKIFPQWSEQILALKPFSFFMQDDFFIARTGYTGEDGFEILMPENQAQAFWTHCISQGVRACGLGARDTLRLEAGFNLFGQDMDETTTPFEANLTWTVDTKDPARQFIGRTALEKKLSEGIHQELIGLIATEACVLRQHYSVYKDDVEIGTITSGSFSPTLNKSIALARINKPIPDDAQVSIRNKFISVNIVTPKFYRAEIAALKN